LIKRTSKNYIQSKLAENNQWNILDIGCGYTANAYANTICDIQDLTNYYKDKNFVKLENKHLPFKDKEFDFVIASHVLEHVEDLGFFITELERVSKKGYIELPTMLGDNLVFENKSDHIWWFTFDDINNIIIASKKNQLIEPFVTVSTAKNLEEIFRDSLVIELFWERKIEYKIDNKIRNEKFKQISFIKLMKKYLSKKIRMLFKK